MSSDTCHPLAINGRQRRTCRDPPIRPSPHWAETDSKPGPEFDRCGNYPCFTPYAYSFQLLIPGVNLQQVDKWTPNGDKGWGLALLIYTWVMIALGWVAGIAVVGGLNNALRKD